MPKIIDLDAIADLTAELQIKISGKVYSVQSLGRNITDKLAEIEAEAERNGTPLHKMACMQCAVLTGQPESEFESLDIRQLKAFVTRVTQEIASAGEFSPRRNARGR